MFIMGLTAVGLILGATTAVSAKGQPLDVLRDKVERGLAILNDPRYRTDPDRVRQEERVWELATEIFDYAIMSRLVLSSHWHDFTPEQRQAFAREFAAFLRRTYLPGLLAQYDGERIAFVRQVMIADNRARVEALVEWRDREIPVTARMIRRNDQWRVYDLRSLGISAVQIYRAQFQWLLRRETPADVIRILKNSPARTATD